MPQPADATNEKGSGFGPKKSIFGRRFFEFCRVAQEGVEVRTATMVVSLLFHRFYVTAAEWLD